MPKYHEIILILVVVCVQLSLCFIGPIANNEGDQLIFAQVIFRHGEKNVKETYPNDPYQDLKYWPGGFNALSNEGKQQTYELGKFLRQRYQNLIGDQYSPDNVYIRCSDTDRSLMSAQCVASGLFPPSRDEVWNADLLWQPVPIHTIALADDIYLNSRVECPFGEQDFYRNVYSADQQSILQEHRSLIKFIEDNSGLKLRHSMDILEIYDVLVAQKRRGLVLPNWANEALKFNETLNYIGGLSYKSFSNSTETKKIRSGFLLKKIFDRFQNKTLDLLKPDRGLWLYSTHGSIIASILNSLDLFDLPTFSASIHFELYQRDTSDYYIQIFYRNSNTDILTPLIISNCGTKCSLEKLYARYEDILPKETEDFKSLCQINSISSVPEGG